MGAAAGNPCPVSALSSVAHGLRPANGVSLVADGWLLGSLDTGAGWPPSLSLQAVKAHASATTEMMAERLRIDPVTV